MSYEQEAIVVPDSIEPLIGYKGLVVDSEGGLWSPLYRKEWPVGEPMEAHCGIKDDPFFGQTWVSHAVEVGMTIVGEDGETWEVIEVGETRPSGTWAGVRLVVTDHDSPAEECHCGIYALNDPKHALDEHCRGRELVVEIASWGTVIPGTRGSRAQYAYPRAILVGTKCDSSLLRRARKAAARYAIPLIRRADMNNRWPRIKEQDDEAWNRFLRNSLAIDAVLLALMLCLGAMITALVISLPLWAALLAGAPLYAMVGFISKQMIDEMVEDWQSLKGKGA